MKSICVALCSFAILTACSGGGKSAEPVQPDAFHGIQVPADPGPLADSTLNGVDTNVNGVRDDVERKIAETYGANAEQYDGAMRLAKSNQQFIQTNGNAAAATAVTQNAVVVGACILTKFGGDAIAAQNALQEVFSLSVNTEQRLRAYKATSDASKAVSTPLPDTPCQ